MQSNGGDEMQQKKENAAKWEAAFSKKEQKKPAATNIASLRDKHNYRRSRFKEKQDIVAANHNAHQ